MEETRKQVIMAEKEGDEEAAELEILNYVLGFTKFAAVKCAIELGIADAIEKHGCPMTLSELSSTLKCEPSLLQRVMRFLVHHRVFKEKPSSQGSIAFEQTPISRRLMRNEENSFAAAILLENSLPMVASLSSMSTLVLNNGTSAFKIAHDKDLWGYIGSHESFGKLFHEAMADLARATIRGIVKSCPEAFDGLGSLVDIGGGNGTAISSLVKAFPWIRGITFDLPHVVDAVEKRPGVEYVAGNMFTDAFPKADAFFFLTVLHDWGDDDCIKVLKKCREVIPADKGKVFIADTVIEEENGRDEFSSSRLMVDMQVIAHTNGGKERTVKEWDYVLRQAGFSRFNVKSTGFVRSLIEAFP